MTLIGDSTANAMRLIVSADAAGESVLIEGLNGTTINGFSEVTFGALDNLVMDLGAGADSVLIEWQGRQGLIGTWLDIDMGKGRDVLEWRGVAQWLGVSVDTGGQDDVTFKDSVFGGKVILDGGLDEDTLHLLGLNLFNKGLDEDVER